MESHLESVDGKMESLRFLSRTIKDTPFNQDTAKKHSDLRLYYIVILRTIRNLLTLCQEDIDYQINRLNRHIEDIKAVKM
jgi:hypothetical protein